MSRFKVQIKSKPEKFEQDYTIPAPDSTMAYTWGEKQAKALGLQNPKIEVVTIKEETT